jgi:PTH1 family peptidyl-tRNA hydrolase
LQKLGLVKALDAESDTMADIKMIVGLGNLGKEYDGTRHNIGFDVVDALASSFGIEVKQKKFGALFGQGLVNGQKLMFLKPAQYMNRSGQAVATAAGFFKLPLKDIIVVTDDLALDVGVIRLRAKGSAGGHNGLKDIIAKTGTMDFARLRIGVGESGRIDTASYVLAKPNKQDREILDESLQKAGNALICWAENGVDATMNKYNVNTNK